MNIALLATMTVTRPAAIVIAIVALGAIYVAFKIAKLVMKVLLVVAALSLIGLMAWCYYAAHHGAL